LPIFEEVHVKLTPIMGILLFTVACGGGQDQPAQEAEMPQADAPAAMSLADFAGTWTMQAMTEAGDSVLVEYEMVATNSPDGWTITFPDREPITPSLVELEGETLHVHIGPYSSALRDDVMVSTVSQIRMVDGALLGEFVATYETEGEDTILRGMQRGQRGY
jgi:hypothetical protein